MRYEPNHAFTREIAASPGMDAVLRSRAGLVRIGAYHAAPRKTGHYRRSLAVVGHAVVAKDIAAHLIEWGSAKNPPYAPLRRGVLAAGLRFREHAR